MGRPIDRPLTDSVYKTGYLACDHRAPDHSYQVINVSEMLCYSLVIGWH